MADIETLRVEVSHMSDRDLLLTILHGQQIQNGTLGDHHDDLYGNPGRQIRGIKPTVESHDKAISAARTSFRTVLTLIGVVGTSNVVALLLLWQRT